VKLRLLLAAEQDIEKLFLYIKEDLANPIAAQNIAQKILRRIQQLTNFPELGASMTTIDTRLENYRYLIVDNYLVVYRYDRDALYVVRVLYARSDYVCMLQG
jgi:plasmid stabilization system protein ParE